MINIKEKAADRNWTVEDLMGMSPKFGGVNYLDMQTGMIVRLEEITASPKPKPEEPTVPKMKGKK